MPTGSLEEKSNTGLPVINLTGQTCPPEALRFIPLAAAEKYQVCGFDVTPELFKVAVVHPEQLKQGFQDALNDISRKVGRKVELYKTDANSFRQLITQYKELERNGNHLEPASGEVSALSKPSDPKPPLFELGKSVVLSFLKRIPLDFARQQRIMCVDYLAPKTYWFVTDGTNDQALTKVISDLATSNDMRPYVITIKPEEFDELYEYYQSKEEAFEKGEPESTEPVSVEPEPEKPNNEVVTADIQGSIISSEMEQRGIAGLIQKVSQNLSAPKEAKKEPEPVTSALPLITPDSGTDPNATEDAATSQTGQLKVRNEDVDDGDIGKLLTKEVDSLDELKEIIKKGFIPRLVAGVISFAIHQKSSDIHIESYQDEVRVRYRTDGQLIDIVRISPEVHAAMVSRIKILARMRLDENRIPQDGRFEVTLGQAQIDLRVSVMPTIHGEKVMMRILDKTKGVASLEALGMTGQGYERLLKMLSKPYGICLMTGPTGAGKSTTLYAILQRIAMPNVNIITLEDPVEYDIKGVNQSQIKPNIGFTFAEGLRAVLRQDPNIIMVGEIRDGETATMATQAALTGHLVLSSLHTNDAAGAIPRLINMGIEPFLIASSFNVAVAQRLVRRLCPDCKAEIDLPPSIMEGIVKNFEAVKALNPIDALRVKEPYKFYQGTGCAHCNGNGYKGRIGIYEVMVNSPEINKLVLNQASAAELQEQSQKEGMITMYQDGLLKALAGLTSLDEVLRETSNK